MPFGPLCGAMTKPLPQAKLSSLGKSFASERFQRPAPKGELHTHPRIQQRETATRAIIEHGKTTVVRSSHTSCIIMISTVPPPFHLQIYAFLTSTDRADARVAQPHKSRSHARKNTLLVPKRSQGLSIPLFSCSAPTTNLPTRQKYAT